MQNTPSIIYEDEDLMVVGKPAGMIVNRADTTKDVSTLQEWVEEKFKVSFGNTPGQQSSKLKVKEEESSDFVKRSGIVHRLDKETSGLIIIASNEDTFVKLQKEFKDGEVEKTYIALSHGKIIPESGDVKVPIGRLPGIECDLEFSRRIRESRTLYKVLGVKKFKSDKKRRRFKSCRSSSQNWQGASDQGTFSVYWASDICRCIICPGRKTAKNDRKYLHFFRSACNEDCNLFIQQAGKESSKSELRLAAFLSTLQ